MKLTSLAVNTDLIFAKFGGELRERDEYLVVRTPANPHYHWGNFLVFREPPRNGDIQNWPRIFREEFADLPEVDHLAFTWDTGGSGDWSQFSDVGFTFETNKVLAANAVHTPKKFCADLELRLIRTDEEWEQVVLSQIMSNEGGYDAVDYEKFKRRQIGDYRRMSEAGLGHWFGGYLGSTLVGDLGIFCDGDLGRFQSVGTHPNYRRQGVCGRLVYDAAKFTFKKFGVKSLVMVADADYHAATIYESVGFLPVEENFTLSKW